MATDQREKHRARMILLAALLCGIAPFARCAEDAQEGEELAALLALSGGGSAVARPCLDRSAAAPAGAYLADVATSAPSDEGAGFFDSYCALNGVRGLGADNGSTDVFSLRGSGAGAAMVLEWSGRRVLNASGADFVVYENVFVYISNPALRFIEPLIVEVSEDNANYCGFDPDYTHSPETSYVQDPTEWLRFAGITPVFYNQESNPLTKTQLFDGTGGGDAFDLDNLSDSNAFATGCNTPLRDSLRSSGFAFLRLRAGTSVINPDTGSVFGQDPGAFGGGPDIDGVIAASVGPR